MNDADSMETEGGRLHRFVHDCFADTSCALYKRMSNVVMAAIFVSIALIVLETVGDLKTQYALAFSIAVVAIFILEYIANVYVTRPRRAHVLGVWGIIDLVAILPTLVEFLPMKGLRVVRVLRVLRFLRLLRILKLARQVSDAYQESSEKRDESTIKLDLQIYFLTMFSVLIISSALMYYAESGYEGTKFIDIPSAMWWGIGTMTTVGYGDLTPLTLAGKLVASVTALCGLALFGMLTQVMGKEVLRGLFGGEADEDGELSHDLEGHDALHELERLAALRDSAAITQSDFETQREHLLSRV